MQRAQKMITKDITVPPGLRSGHSKAELKWMSLKKCSAFISMFFVVSIIATSRSRFQSYSSSPNDHRSQGQPITKTVRLPILEARQGDEAFWCDRSDNRTDVCFMRGDVHLVPQARHSTSLILYSMSAMFWQRDEIIWPYARKFDNSTLRNVGPVAMRKNLVKSEFVSPKEAPLVCDIVHNSPVLVFSTGGFTGNAFHDFNDVIIPLFITSRIYDGDVIFGITDVRDWWIDKFGALFGLLSRYKILNINSAKEIHCFPEATVGLRVHGELAINPSQMANNETIKDFQKLLHEAFAPEMKLTDNYRQTGIDAFDGCCVGANADHERSNTSTARPLKMVIFSRNASRIILNVDEVVHIAMDEGFDVEVLEPAADTEMRTLYRLLHSADVMIGVHGAALTHMLFMRRRSVFIQIVPLGAEWPAHNCFKEPAENGLDLQYIEYSITPNESSLSGTYSMDDVALTDPESLVVNNWDLRRKMYLDPQNVCLSILRVQETFREAKRLAFQAFR